LESKRKNSYSAYTDLGLEFAVAIALGVGLGYLADKKLNTLPLFLLIGLLLGATSGFLNIYRTVFPKNDTTKKSNKAPDEN
jgi:F0F1-type ATP synthase assembly protein I